MITQDNFLDHLKDIKPATLNDDLKALHFFVMESTEGGTNWKAYKEPEVKPLIDEYFKQLNDHLKPKGVPEKKTDTQATTKAPIKKGDPVTVYKAEKSNPVYPQTKKKASADKEEDEMDFDFKERIPDEIRFMRRYLSLHNRKKTKDDLLRFINSLHRSILEHKIRKSSPFAKQIEYIQGKLVSTYNDMARVVNIQINDKIIAEFKSLITSEKVKPSVQLIKRYLTLNGKFGVKDKAKNLLEAMVKANENGKIAKRDQYTRLLDKMHKNLSTYIKNKSQKILTIERTELNGLNGILGENEDLFGDVQIEEVDLSGVDGEQVEPQNEEAEVMSLHEAKTAVYDTIGLEGKYLMLIGDACTPTHLFAYGSGGGGKSSFALQYAAYLNSLGKRVLYVAGEEYGTPTFTNLLNRLNIHGNENFVIVKGINVLNPKDFDVVVLDSKDSLGIEVEDFRELKKAYPEQSFIITSQGTKGGDHTGSGQWRNEVDTMVYCETGIAKTGTDKNRWGGKGEIQIFDQLQPERAAA